MAQLSARAFSVSEQRMAALQRREEAEAQGVRDAADGSLSRAERLAALDQLEDDSHHASNALCFSSHDDSPDFGVSSLDRPLPPSNFGFQMLLKMGWGGLGKGLGRRGQGIAEPIRPDGESGSMGLGIGKRAEMDAAADEATASRRTMQTEALANETPEQRAVREAEVANTARIASTVTAALSSLRCDECDKQYTLATDFQTHIMSYDHAHTVRMREMRRTEQARKMAALAAGPAGGGGAEGQRQRRQAKEDARLEAQMKAAMAAMQPPPPPVAAVAAAPVAPVPPPPQQASAQQQPIQQQQAAPSYGAYPSAHPSAYSAQPYAAPPYASQQQPYASYSSTPHAAPPYAHSGWAPHPGAYGQQPQSHYAAPAYGYGAPHSYAAPSHPQTQTAASYYHQQAAPAAPPTYVQPAPPAPAAPAVPFSMGVQGGAAKPAAPGASIGFGMLKRPMAAPAGKPKFAFSGE